MAKQANAMPVTKKFCATDPHTSLQQLDALLKKADTSRNKTLKELDIRLDYTHNLCRESNSEMSDIIEDYAARFDGYHDMSNATLEEKKLKKAEREALMEKSRRYASLMSKALESHKEPAATVKEAGAKLETGYSEVLTAIEDLHQGILQRMEQDRQQLQEKGTTKPELNSPTLDFHNKAVELVQKAKDEIHHEAGECHKHFARKLEENREKQAQIPGNLCESKEAEELQEQEQELCRDLELNTDTKKIDELYATIMTTAPECREAAGALKKRKATEESTCGSTKRPRLGLLGLLCLSRKGA